MTWRMSSPGRVRKDSEVCVALAVGMDVFLVVRARALGCCTRCLSLEEGAEASRRPGGNGTGHGAHGRPSRRSAAGVLNGTTARALQARARARARSRGR